MITGRRPSSLHRLVREAPFCAIVLPALALAALSLSPCTLLDQARVRSVDAECATLNVPPAVGAVKLFVLTANRAAENPETDVPLRIGQA